MGNRQISNRRLKEIRSLSQKKYRERLGEMLIEGMRSVEAAVEADAAIKEVLVTEEAWAQAKPMLKSIEDRIYMVSDEEMDSVSNVETSQGILAVAAIELVRREDLRRMRRIVVFDGIQDPGNAGTLLRSAAWFGVDAVVTAPGTVDLYNPKVVRAAMGGLWDAAHVAVEDLSRELAILRREGFALYAADLEGTPIDEWEPHEPSALVFGSEAHGVSEPVREHLDARIVIPGRSGRRGVESLNVAVAAGIVLYAWTKGRKSG